MTFPVWLTGDEKHAVLTLHIQPSASKTSLVGEHGAALKVRLAAPPVDGKANTALLAYLSGILDIPANALELLSGASSRSKRVKAVGISAEAVSQRLGAHCRMQL